jgi:hypothetical protein
MPMRERKQAEQMSLFAAAPRWRSPRWEALAVEVRRQVVNLLVRLLRDRALRRTDGRGEVGDE